MCIELNSDKKYERFLVVTGILGGEHPKLRHTSVPETRDLPC